MDFIEIVTDRFIRCAIYIDSFIFLWNVFDDKKANNNRHEKTKQKRLKIDCSVIETVFLPANM